MEVASKTWTVQFQKISIEVPLIMVQCIIPPFGMQLLPSLQLRSQFFAFAALFTAFATADFPRFTATTAVCATTLPTALATRLFHSLQSTVSSSLHPLFEALSASFFSSFCNALSVFLVLSLFACLSFTSAAASAFFFLQAATRDRQTGSLILL